MVYGYARCSTKFQSLERQYKNIYRINPDAKIFSDLFTGTTSDRPGWNKLMKIIKPGDRIIFDSVSRMSRNAEEGFATYQELFSKDITLIFVNEPYCDTDVYKQASSQKISLTGEEIADIYIEATNRVLQIVARKQIQIAFDQAQKEVDDIHTRVAEGMAAKGAGEKIRKKRKGKKYKTRKETIAKEIIKKNSKTFSGTNSDKEVMQMIKGALGEAVEKDLKFSGYQKAGIDRNTYYKYKREIAEELGLAGDNYGEKWKQLRI